jgi:hypothetical protein
MGKLKMAQARPDTSEESFEGVVMTEAGISENGSDELERASIPRQDARQKGPDVIA